MPLVFESEKTQQYFFFLEAKRVPEGRWFERHFGYTGNHYLSLLMFNMHTGPENVSAYIGLEHEDKRQVLNSINVQYRNAHFTIIYILLL